MRLLPVLLCFALLALAACAGGRGSTGVLSPDGPRDAAGLKPTAGDVLPDGSPSPEFLQAQWEAWLADPGAPGVDYDPTVINVAYAPAALNFRSASGIQLPAGMAAADQPNAVLRREPGYCTITDSIAASQPVSVRTQVYYGSVVFASFSVNDGADAAAVLAAIRRDYAPYIEYAAYAMLYHAAYSPTDSYYTNSNDNAGPLWSLHRINVGQGWDYTKGAPGVTMADVDTGVRMSHQELDGQVLDPVTLAAGMGPGTFFDLVHNDNTVEDVNDVGHGTFIAGVMAAAGNDGQPLVGVAFQCRVIPVKIADGGTAPDDRLIAGCLLGFEAGARVVNLSWGGYFNNPQMQAMVNEIYNNGGLFVGAAGNDNVTDFHYPSDYPNAVSVGSTDPVDNRADFSNYSTAVDIAAPGVPLISTGNHSDDEYHDSYLGTSFSAPMVAAAAALLWSYKPELTNAEVRDLLENTGAAIDGFQATTPPVLRLDLAAAFDEVDAIRVSPPRPQALIQHGTISLTPEVKGEPDRVECFFNGVLVGTLTAAPWTFVIDTTPISFDKVLASFVAHKGGEQATATVNLVVDNTAGNFPVVEDFEATSSHFAPLDLKSYHLDVIKEAKFIPGPGANWSEDDVASQGPASWHSTMSNPFDGSVSMVLGTAQSSYGNYELDALVSRRIKLTGVSNGTMVFYHHYNIEDGGSGFDRGWVYVTNDYGNTLAAAELKTGGSSYFTGYLPGWTKAEIDLSAFSGLVNIVLVFESDQLGIGEQSGSAGWWLDNITVSTNYNENVPTLTGVNVTPYSYYGTVPDHPELDIDIEETQNVDRVRFILDMAPVGVLDFTGEQPDIIKDAFAAPFGEIITELPNYPNQLANLRIQYFDALNNPGPEIVVPVYIFNLRGDVNADNIVDAADNAAYDGKVGLSSADLGYSPLFDSDLDGVITEADAAAVGYFWGASI